MTSEEVHQMLMNAVNDMFAAHPNLFAYTEATSQTEWNLAHQLAPEIRKYIPQYDCDLDVVKTVAGNRRPDIIFHSIGDYEHDFLVIELKLNGTPRALLRDRNKIIQYWFPQPLNYQYGAVINLCRDLPSTVDVIVNENWAN